MVGGESYPVLEQKVALENFRVEAAAQFTLQPKYGALLFWHVKERRRVAFQFGRVVEDELSVVAFKLKVPREVNNVRL